MALAQKIDVHALEIAVRDGEAHGLAALVPAEGEEDFVFH